MKIEALIDSLDKEPVSWSLAKALRLAELGGNEAFTTWCRLELGGYLASNPVMTEDIVVPEYRSVPGQYSDIYGSVLSLPANLSFVNETHLRNGVEELESLADDREVVSMHDPGMCDLIKRHLDVEVYAFRFSTVHLAGVLSAIRRELSDRLHALQPVLSTINTPDTISDEEIVEIRPNMFGVGVNLRALWRKVMGTDTKT